MFLISNVHIFYEISIADFIEYENELVPVLILSEGMGSDKVFFVSVYDIV